MTRARNILVIGGGPAGVMAAIAAKRQDSAASVLLLSDETCEPYEKPPLSKAVLTGKAAHGDAPIAGKDGVAAHGVVLRCGARVGAIDRAARTVTLEGGERLPYDALVLATGSLERELPLLPAGMARVHYLRSEAHARALKDELAAASSVVVIGGGLIGLEVAASAAELGKRVTVFELAPRILARVCDPETAALVHAEHTNRGVEIRTGTSVTKVEPAATPLALTTSAGDTLTADLVVVGIGVAPDTRLARAAGLDLQDGIVVDAQGRTSDPHIFAAGDCTQFPGPGGLVRLENWRHAQDHGAIAGRNAAGGSDEYRAVPSYWSEQYDLYVQGIGWPQPQPDAQVRRPLPGKASLLLDLKDGVIGHALGVNAQRDLAAVRRLIERRVPVDAAALADPAQPFNAMLKKA
jgi:NADPH-dependent 2,4-dienoyl-CoA reductase/sulfur reductase-like enzyme